MSAIPAADGRALQPHATSGVRTRAEKLRAFSRFNPRMATHFAQTMLAGPRAPEMVEAFKAHCDREGFEFSYDTVSNNIAFAGPIVKDFVAAQGPETLRYLEIGAFEGRNLAFLDWLVPGRLRPTVIDAWFDEQFNPDEKYKDIEARFHRNMARTRFSSVDPRRGFSGDVLPTMRKAGAVFDLIYVDGSHTALDVMIDLCFCANLLRVGGMMILDDYWHDISDISGPGVKQAVDHFVGMFHQYFAIEAVYRQVVLIKSAEIPR